MSDGQLKKDCTVQCYFALNEYFKCSNLDLLFSNRASKNLVVLIWRTRLSEFF